MVYILYYLEIIALKYNVNNKNNYIYLKNSTNIENYNFHNIDLRYCSSQRIKPKEFYYETELLPIKKGILNDIEINIPNNSIKIIKRIFGEDWKKLYKFAIKNNYRFLSYGDSSLLFKK